MKDTMNERAARDILRKFSRSALEMNASEIMAFPKIKDMKLTRDDMEQIERIKKYYVIQLENQSDEDLRKFIFEHDFPGHYWRRRKSDL